MKLEGVGSVSMGDCRFQIRRKIDDCDGLERASRRYGSAECKGSLAPHALFYANTTPDAKKLGDEGDLV
jgi:hypothetical protein